MNADKKIRIDQYLVREHLAESRNKAVWMIEEGWVWVNNEKVLNKSLPVWDADTVIVKPLRRIYVSQGGYKLEKALDFFKLDFSGSTVLDIGASTGGFVDCALQHGAKRVVAIDIGSGQLHSSLQDDSRVMSLEHTDIRHVEPEQLPIHEFNYILVDVSFISITHIFSSIKKFMGPNTLVIALLKPQFEQKERRKFKGGIIKDSKIRLSIIEKVQEYILNEGFEVLGFTETDADPEKKNIEFLLLLQAK